MTAKPDRALVEPHVHPGCVPVIGLAQDIELPIAIEIPNLRFVETHARLENRLAKVALPVSEEDEGLGPGVVGFLLPLTPLGHFRDEDVEMAIAVDVGHLERVRMDHRPSDQIVSLPAFRLERMVLALIPLYRPDAVAGGDDDLGIFSILDEPAGKNEAADVADPGGRPFPLSGVFENVVERQ